MLSFQGNLSALVLLCFVFLFRWGGGTYIHDLDEKFGKTRQRHGKSKQESLKQTTPAIHTELKIIFFLNWHRSFQKRQVGFYRGSGSVLYLDWLRSCELGDRSPDRYRLVWTLEIEISNTLCKVYRKQFSTVHEIFDVISWRHWTTDFKHWATCVEIKFLCNSALDDFRNHVKRF